MFEQRHERGGPGIGLGAHHQPLVGWQHRREVVPDHPRGDLAGVGHAGEVVGATDVSSVEVSELVGDLLGEHPVGRLGADGLEELEQGRSPVGVEMEEVGVRPQAPRRDLHDGFVVPRWVPRDVRPSESERLEILGTGVVGVDRLVQVGPLDDTGVTRRGEGLERVVAVDLDR